MKTSLLLGCVIVFSGCGSSSNFAGNFKGPETGTQNGTAFSATMTVEMTQDGDKVTGTWSSSSGSKGTVSGTANGDTLKSFAATSPSTDQCPGTYTGDLTIKDNKLSGTIVGTSNTCGTISATVDLTKQ